MKSNKQLFASTIYQTGKLNKLYLNSKSKRNSSLLSVSSRSNKERSGLKADGKENISLNASRDDPAYRLRGNNEGRATLRLEQSEKQPKSAKNVPTSQSTYAQGKRVQEQRPHQSQNLAQLAHSASKPSRKLYTFCGEGRNPGHPSPSHPETSSVAESDLPQSPCSATIIVKQEQLKKFTHKFAREKIEQQEQISALREAVCELKVCVTGLRIDKQDLMQCLNYKEAELAAVREELNRTNQRLVGLQLGMDALQDQYNHLGREKTIKIDMLEQMLSEKQHKMDEILAELMAKQRQLLSMQHSRQSSPKMSALLNLPPANSIYSMQSEPSSELMHELQYYRQECANLERALDEKQQAAQYARIQYEHMRRQLELQKLGNQHLRQELIALKTSSQNRVSAEEQKNKITAKQTIVNDLREQNEQLRHGKETLQKSLQVSSTMILHLREENSRLKDILSNAALNQDSNQFTQAQVKTIIHSLMRDQLQLQQKLQQLQGQNNKMKLSESLRLQRRFEQGYQSVRQHQKSRHSKTQALNLSQSSHRQALDYAQGSICDGLNKTYELCSYEHAQDF